MTPIVGGVPTITWAEAKATDGVYGIYEGKPVLYSEAESTSETLSGVAIVMYGRALQISNSQLTGQTWGDKTVNISGITDVTQAGGGVTNKYGYLPKPDGSYVQTHEYFKIKEGYENWRNYPNTALADTAGWSNTEALIAEQNTDIYIGPQTKAFREGSLSISNQGYSDWFVPAAGQLAYIYLKMKQINAVLGKCGGTTLPTDWSHWSSSEHSDFYASDVVFSGGRVGYDIYGKDMGYYVRFCRYITE